MNRWDKPFTEDEVLDCLVDILWLISKIRDEKSLINAHSIRNQMEAILLGQPISKFENIKSYIKKARIINAVLSDKIDGMYRMRKPK